MIFRVLLACFLLSGFANAQTKQRPQHPLDALTPDEIAETVKILSKASAADKATDYPWIELLEPPKADVLAWKQGDPLKRKVFAVLRNSNDTYETIVDLDAKKVESNVKIDNAEPMVMDREWFLARDKAMNDKRFKQALERRGYNKLDNVYCTPVPAGYFPDEGYENRRILKVPCYDVSNRLHPVFARPIEGLLAVVDIEKGDVLDVIDRDVVPLPPPPEGYGKDQPKPRAAMKPVNFFTPKGSNITITGNFEVSWHDWSLHIRPDKRAGLILSLARFQDRMVAYQMAVSELFVPYMDPDPTWSFKTYMDAGEFGLGYLISSLQPGVDCPPDSIYADLTFPNDVGATYTRPKAMCIFERATGDPAWRHYNNGKNPTIDGRPETELVVRYIPTLGNYDYLIDYVFKPRGAVKLRVGATGFDAIKSVEAKDMEAPTAEADTAYGSLIAPYTVAPHHDHYVNFRLDLDVDGVENSFVRDVYVPQAIEESPARKSIWKVKTQRYKTEGPIVPDHAAKGGEVWRVVNPNKKTALKYHPSYLIHGHHQPVSILDPSDPPQMRAGFSSNTLWVSANKQQAEYWAAGRYSNQSKADKGLPAFVSQGESIVNTDLVVWYTMGFRHITKPEDFPILPTLWHEVTLTPAYFFDRDPSSLLNPGMKQ
jgi:primary-amine oxidase